MILTVTTEIREGVSDENAVVPGIAQFYAMATCIRRHTPGMHDCRNIGMPSTVCRPGLQIGILT